jgi:uncharacterized protein (DUF2235 family)
MYARDDKKGWKQSTTFKKTFSMDVEIEFVGVWYTFSPFAGRFIGLTHRRDTVCSVGLIPHTLPFTRSNTTIRYFRHALSLDERRAKFKANYWHRLSDSDQKGTELGEMPRSNQRHPHYHGGHHSDHQRHTSGVPPRVREVWFAGCHCGMCDRLDATLPI